MDDWICLFTYTLWRYLLILHGCLGNHIFFIQRHLIIVDSAYPGPDMIFLQKILPRNPYIPLPPKSLTRGLFELSPLDYHEASEASQILSCIIRQKHEILFNILSENYMYVLVLFCTYPAMNTGGGWPLLPKHLHFLRLKH